MLNSLNLKEFDNDQRREFINTQQRYQVWRNAVERLDAVRGSMVWQTTGSNQYLARSSYDKSGVRRQKSLGPRSPETEQMKLTFEQARDEARERFKTVDAALTRQAAINRSLGLGRVPLVTAKIIRALDRGGSLGNGLRIVGTNAIFAYEAMAGVMVDQGLATTGDIDLLFDSRSQLRFVVSDDIPERSLLTLLRSVDKSFMRSRQRYRAENADGYLVDLIKPMRNPPWKKDRDKVSEEQADDLTASEIEGLVWLENAPAFEAIAIDERGFPLRMVTADPRVWAIHKNWVSQRLDRDPVKKRRDSAQARAVGAMVTAYFPHLPVEMDELRMLPRDVVADAAPIFAATS